MASLLICQALAKHNPLAKCPYDFLRASASPVSSCHSRPIRACQAFAESGSGCAGMHEEQATSCKAWSPEPVCDRILPASDITPIVDESGWSGFAVPNMATAAKGDVAKNVSSRSGPPESASVSPFLHRISHGECTSAGHADWKAGSLCSAADAPDVARAAPTHTPCPGEQQSQQESGAHAGLQDDAAASGLAFASGLAAAQALSTPGHDWEGGAMSTRHRRSVSGTPSPSGPTPSGSSPEHPRGSGHGDDAVTLMAPMPVDPLTYRGEAVSSPCDGMEQVLACQDNKLMDVQTPAPGKDPRQENAASAANAASPSSSTPSARTPLTRRQASI